MRLIFTIILAVVINFSFAQDKDKEKQQQLTLDKANSYVYQANELIEADNFISAEKEYRKAISELPSNIAGTYNLGHSYYEKGNYEEALYRHTEAAKSAVTKKEKHHSYHNIGNIFMKEKLCKEAVEAYKSALRNDPTDDETRYNLAVAKECAAQQKQDQDKKEDKKDEDKENDEKKEDKEEDKKDDPKDEGNQDKKEGDDEKDKDGKPKDEKDQSEGEKKEDKKEQGKPKPQPGQLSAQQIKNLLEAMNNQEKKVQEKINAEKQKGAKVKTEKDW